MATTGALPFDASWMAAIGDACSLRWSKAVITIFSRHVPVTKILIPRVFSALARLASVPLMLPPLPQSTLMGVAYAVDVETKNTTSRLKMLPSSCD
jgi:hypothetical protein